MSATVLNYLGLGSKQINGHVNGTVKKQRATRALPSNWYNSEEFWQLERRAIFSRKWMMITHKMRIAEPGQWLKFEVAGYEFILSNKNGEIHGFHNICRHRGFPVVQGDQGTARIFSCKYHGWSYGIDGKLAKAPRYEEFEGFDKSQNGMFPIHVKVDCNGFIWVNLDAKKVPEVSWEDNFAGVDTQPRLLAYNFDDYELDHVYQMEGAYNWKILADNFNECYHCPTAHPTINQMADVNKYDSYVNDDYEYIIHQSQQDEEQERLGLAIASTYYFPNVSLSVLPNFIMLQRFLPRGPNHSVMQYQIFRRKTATEEQFQVINKLYAQVMSEDKVLCELTQKNLNQGIFVNGEMHTRLERGPLFFQKVCRDVIRAHVERERNEKREIWPARQILPEDAQEAKEDFEICSGLACGAERPVALAW